MYQAKVDEQRIIEQTMHKSINGVRQYKRTNEKQRLETADLIAAKKKKLEVVSSPYFPPSPSFMKPISNPLDIESSTRLFLLLRLQFQIQLVPMCHHLKLQLSPQQLLL